MQKGPLVCVCARVSVCPNLFEYMHMSERVCVSLAGNIYVYAFCRPSAPQQKLSELFTRSLATLIMSGPPQSINQPSAAPTQPTNRSSGQCVLLHVCVCVCVCRAAAELFKGSNLRWMCAVSTVIPVISAFSAKTSVGMSEDVSVVPCVKILYYSRGC